MVQLTDLSNEILFNIVAYLTTGNDTEVQTLLHLCRTSHRLRDIAQPALSTTVTIAEPAGEPLRSLKTFLKVCLNRPSLAKRTQELALFNDRRVSYEWPALGHDTDFMELSSLIGGHPGEIEPELCYHPLAVEVLTRLPNLQHLHLTAQIEPPRALLKRMHQLRAESFFFSKLTTFHLRKQYEDGPVNLEDYIPLMRYPAFRRFSTENDVPDAPNGSRAINSLTHATAELTWCMGPLLTMTQLLDACPHLSIFQLIIPDTSRLKQWFDVAYQPLVAPRGLVNALIQSHRHILKNLYLDFHHGYNLGDPELREEIEELEGSLEDCAYTYPSFRDFKCLSHMTIEFEKLVKVSDLPATLKSLALNWCRFSDLDSEFLGELFLVKEKWCPVIESIAVSGWERTNEGIKTVCERSRSLYLRVRVSSDERLLTVLGVGYHLQILSHPLSTGDELEGSRW